MSSVLYDESFFVGLAALFIGYLIVFLVKRWNDTRNIPPGPAGLPLLGYAPFFGPHPEETLLKLGKKYGNIFSVRMGPTLAIVLNDFDAIKAAYVDQADVFAGRADGFMFRYFSTGTDGRQHGLIPSQGEEWKVLHTFILSAFRSIGVLSKNGFQQQLSEESEHLNDSIRAIKGQKFDPQDLIFASAGNIMASLNFGKRFDHFSPIFKTLLGKILELSELLGQAGPMQSYPLLRFIPGTMRNFWLTFTGNVGKQAQIMEGMIEEHKMDNAAKESNDYINAFLAEQEKEVKQQKLEGKTLFTKEALVVHLRHYFGAGSEPTSVTMLWTLLYLILIHFPKVQEEAQKLIDELTGGNRPVTLDDRPNLTYIDAIIWEVQRRANVVPFGILRANLQETTLLGFRIPKDSFIIPNYLAVYSDPVLWDRPELFMPERFLDENRKLIHYPFFAPFSIGKRTCPGEALVRMEMFVFVANILREFSIRFPKDQAPPDLDHCISSITRHPYPFDVVLTPRFSVE